MIDEHIDARFHLVGPGVEHDDPRRRWEATVILPIALEDWDRLKAEHPGAGEALYRAAFEHVRPHLGGVPTSVQFLKVARILIDTIIGRIASTQERTNLGPTYWLAGEGPLDADGLSERFPKAMHALEQVRATGGRKILVHGILHDFGPHDRRVAWEEAWRSGEPSHRLLTMEGGYHPPLGVAGLVTGGDA
jgi:hypothetical protein